MHKTNIHIPAIIFIIFTLIFSLQVKAEFKIIFNFDDGYQGVYNYAYPILKKAKIPAVVFMPTNLINKKGHLTLDQLKELKETGWEIGSHTANHPNLKELTVEGIKYEVNYSRKTLINKGLIKPDYASFCSPMTIWNENIARIVGQNYQLARGKKIIIFPENYSPEAIYKVIVKTTGVNKIKAWLKEARQKDCYLVLIFHEVAPGGNHYFFSPQKLSKLINYIERENVITYKQLYYQLKKNKLNQ